MFTDFLTVVSNPLFYIMHSREVGLRSIRYNWTLSRNVPLYSCNETCFFAASYGWRVGMLRLVGDDIVQ